MTSSKFSENMKSRPRFTSNDFKKLSDPEKLSLEIPFSEEEIKRAIWSCGSDKARGPDGYSFKFIKLFWDVLKEDIISFVHISPGPDIFQKVRDPVSLSDYRVPVYNIG